jgi:hypothetical protein
MVQRSKGKPAPQPPMKRRTRSVTDVMPRKVDPMAPKPRKQKAPLINGKAVLPKVKGALPKGKGRILDGKGYTTPALPSSSSKMGKMNRRAY